MQFPQAGILGNELAVRREDAGDADQVAHFEARVAERHHQALQLVAMLAYAVCEEALFGHKGFDHSTILPEIISLRL
jgi:hypothetical protein